MINETLNANAYINVLEENVLNFDGVEDIIFMQDLVPCHREVFKAR
jgi:hypothetical protein